MTQESIFIPMIVMAFLTFIPLGLIPFKRFQSGFQGRTTPDDFKLGESAKVPPDVAIPNRNYMSTLEAPVLFHVIILALYVTHKVDMVFLDLSWAYVALRAAHSVIHLTYNRVIHRLIPFAISNFVLIAMWVMFAMKLCGR